MTDINTMEKIKLYSYLSLMCLCIFLTVYSIGSSQNDLSSGGGKAGLFHLVLTLVTTIIEPIFGSNSIAFVYFLLSIVFMMLTWKYYKIISSTNNSKL